MPIYIEILKSKPHDKRELNRYIKFIESCIENNAERENLVAHHICPGAKDMFPEYKKFKKYPWNKAMLTERQHYIAHMMLWKTYRNESMTYAFNMMSNFQQTHFTSRLYEKHRADFRKFISDLSSRPRTDYEKKILSNANKNSLVVYDIRDPDRKLFRIHKDSDEYNPKYHVFYRTGRKHSKETKNKIGKSGKKYCYNTETMETKMVYEKDLPKNFIWGYPPGVLNADHVKNTVWCHNPETKKHIRVSKDEIPEGFVIGRIMEENPGFRKANSMINVVDLKNKKVDKVLSVDRKYHAPESGTTTKKTRIYTFDNKIFTSKKNVIYYLSNIGYYIEIGRGVFENIEEIRVKKPHTNCKKEIYSFRKKYEGKTYKELGLRVYDLENFNLSEHKEKEIYWND